MGVRRQWLWVLVLAAGLLPTAPTGAEKPFTVVLLPDTQNYAAFFPETFLAQTRWIKDQREKMNIRYVLHLGDLTEADTAREWKLVDKAMGLLDDVVPYTVVPGNHDGHYGRRRDTRRYNGYFGPQRFKGKKHYVGHYGDANDSNVSLFEAGGMKFMVLGLEFGPRDEVLKWAGEQCAKYKDRKVIVVTHCYMYFDDTRVGEGDSSNPHVYARDANDGEQMWEKFVKHHANIFLVVSGHIRPKGAGRLTSGGEHGNAVHQMLANYQAFKKGGNGWLRILKFVPDENKIVVTTWSPTLKRELDDDAHSFELKYIMTPAAAPAAEK